MAENADLKMKQVCIKFFFELEKNVMETYETLKDVLDGSQWEKHKFLSGFPSSRAV
jgi:hypothetical protein